MKISYNWLRDYVDVDLTSAQLAEKLTLVGLEVDDTEEIDLTLDGVVVGRVLEVKQHPNADRLVLCDVDDGSEEPVQIVCGAPNVAAGQLVPVATPGTVLNLPDRDNPGQTVPVKIRKSKIRGEKSAGMICAEDELGLSTDHSGIMVLDPTAKPGEVFGDYLNAHGYVTTESVFDIELTPNRPDATSHVGVAREVAAAVGSELKYPSIPNPISNPPGKLDITIENPDGCHRYCGVLIEGVTIAESPDWLKQRLEAIGLRPRNNIVDVTNFVMMELGQPLHAFDYDALGGNAIVVRNADSGTSFTTLDGVERRLDGEMLMICDGSGPVAIAGVMGGENSEVTDATTNILVESAWFDPASVRRTARTLGLQSDASYRFERGVDPAGTMDAAHRAANLIVELGGGTVKDSVDVHPRVHEPVVVDLRPARVGVILGVDIATSEMVRLLEQIGFGVSEVDGVLRCTVPSFRPDVSREIDLVEEVARLHGFDNIPSPQSCSVPYRVPLSAPAERLRFRVLEFLAGLGFRETCTNSLIAPAVAAEFATLLDADGKAVETFNAIARDMSALRPSLLPGLLRVAAHNANHGQRLIRFAEFGHVFHRGRPNDDRPTWVPGYVERESLVLLAGGPVAGAAWDRPETVLDLFDLKGILDSLARHLGVTALAMNHDDKGHPVVESSLLIYLDDKCIGRAGKLDDKTAAAFEIDDPLFFAEFFWTPVADAATIETAVPFRPVSRFPSVSRDLAFVVDKSVRVDQLLTAIRSVSSSLLQEARVFDIYQGKGLPSNQKSVGIGLRFAAERTLVDKEVDDQIAQIVDHVQSQWNAKLRS